MAELKSGWSTNHRSTVAGAQKWGYIANGYDPQECWDGLLSAAVQAGFSTPTSAPTVADGSSGSVTAGAHYIRYRYRDDETGYVGEPSVQAILSAAGGKVAECTTLSLSSDPRVDRIILEMTAAGGTVFYEALDMAEAASGNINIPDAALTEMVLDYDEDGHNRPPYGRVQCFHRGRMWITGPVEHAVGTASCAGSTTAVTFQAADIRAVLAGNYFHKDDDTKAYYVEAVVSTGDAGQITLGETYMSSFSSSAYRVYPASPNRVYFSKALYPESFPVENYFTALQGTGDTLTALTSWGTSLIIYGKRNMERYEYEEDPTDVTDARLYSIPGDRGAVCQEAVVEHAGKLYAMDSKGIHRWAGGLPEEIATPAIRDLIESVDFSQASEFHAVKHPTKDLLLWFVCYGSETEPQTVLVWDVAKEQWGTFYFDRPVTASDVCPDSTELMRLFLATTDGKTFFGDSGYSDGAYPGTTMKGTVASGATVTSVAITEAGMWTSGPAGDGLAGVAAYWEEGDEVRPMASNTSTSFVVSPAYTSAPSPGDTVLFGRIVSRLKTKRFRLGVPDEDQQEAYLIVDFTPLSSSKTLIVRVYEDGSATPKSDWEANTAVNGVTFQASDPDILVDLSTDPGYVKIPLADSWHRSVEFEFRVEEPNIPLELIRYYVVAKSEKLEDDE